MNPQALYRFDAFELDPSRRILAREGVPVPLSPKAFEVLTYLVMNPGRVVTKDELLKAVWPDAFVEESNLAQHIYGMRKAMGDGANCIVTIPGRGYQFTAKVRAEHQVETLPEQMPGDVFVQRVRERTHVVIENLPPVAEPLALTAGQPRRRRALLGWAAISLAAAALLALAAMLLWKHLFPPPAVRKVMVADFANSTGDAAFDRTLKRALEIELEQSPYIDVMSQREELSTLKLMGRNDNPALTAELAREVCERSNRQVLLSGNIATLGQEFLVTLEATDCATGKKLAGAKAEAATKEKVLAALDSVAGHVRRDLGESAKSLESYRVPVVNATTPSLEALKSYSTGQYLGAQGGSDADSLPFYQRAVELDPQFAMAYGAIGSVYYNQNEYNLAAQYYRKAFELVDRVSAREKLEIEAHYYSEGQQDVLEGIKVYQMWAETYPHDWVPWVNLTNEFTQLGQYDAAIEAGKRAVAEAPGRGIAYSVLARAYKRANRFAEAKAVGEQAKQRGKDSAGLHNSLFQIAFAENDTVALKRESEWEKSHESGWYFLDVEAEAAAAQGRYRAADGLFRSATEAAEREKLPEAAGDVLLDQAQFENMLGMQEQARATLGRIKNPDAVSPDFAILRAELGDASPAEHYLAAHGENTHPGTQIAFVTLPRVRAALAMRRGKPLEAVEALDAAKPFELADFFVLSERAAAYLAAKRADDAAAAYRKILANPGVDPVSPLYPLAHLGLGRALALAGDKAGSRREYEAFFAAWKDADASVPILMRARTEYQQLK